MHALEEEHKGAPSVHVEEACRAACSYAEQRAPCARTGKRGALPTQMPMGLRRGPRRVPLLSRRLMRAWTRAGCFLCARLWAHGGARAPASVHMGVPCVISVHAVCAYVFTWFCHALSIMHRVLRAEFSMCGHFRL